MGLWGGGSCYVQELVDARSADGFSDARSTRFIGAFMRWGTHCLAPRVVGWLRCWPVAPVRS
jgi:hypothetical protein